MKHRMMVDEVIKSKCRKREVCCICGKSHTKPYIIPEREIIETIYRETSSFEIFKRIKAFWFCEEHYSLFQEYQENGCESLGMDHTIKYSYDVRFLGRLEQMLEDVETTIKRVRDCLPQ